MSVAVLIEFLEEADVSNWITFLGQYFLQMLHLHSFTMLSIKQTQFIEMMTIVCIPERSC